MRFKLFLMMLLHIFVGRDELIKLGDFFQKTTGSESKVMPSVGVPQWIADGMVASVEMNFLLIIFSANSYTPED